jgi:hypothetical protein
LGVDSFACEHVSFGDLEFNFESARLVPNVSGFGPRVGLGLNVERSNPGFVQLRWKSAVGEYFSVEHSTNLRDGFTGVLQSNILATPPTNSVVVPMVNDRCYYRLKFCGRVLSRYNAVKPRMRTEQHRRGPLVGFTDEKG